LNLIFTNNLQLFYELKDKLGNNVHKFLRFIQNEIQIDPIRFYYLFLIIPNFTRNFKCLHVSHIYLLLVVLFIWYLLFLVKAINFISKDNYFFNLNIIFLHPFLVIILFLLAI